MRALQAANNTAPAAMSLLTMARAFVFFVVRSTEVSSAVFNNSVIITNAMLYTIIVHSILEIFNMVEKMIAMIEQQI